MGSNGTSSVIVVSQTVFDPSKDFYFNHGWWLWVSWGILGYVLLLTKRYLSFAWSYSSLVHYLVGYFVIVATIYWSLKSKSRALPGSKPDLHGVLGLIVLSSCFVLLLSGVGSVLLGRFYTGTKDWSHHREIHIVIGKFHKIGGYLVIALGIVASSTGLFAYQEKFYDQINPDRRLPISNILFFALLILVTEIIFRIWRKFSKVEVKKSTKEISIESFRSLVHFQ